MNKLQYKKGLLYTSVELKYKEKSIIIKDAIIDTGASHTIISTEYLEQMDIPLLDDDELVKATGYGGMICYSIRKKLDEIRCGNLVVKDIKLDFGVIDPKDVLKYDLPFANEYEGFWDNNVGIQHPLSYIEIVAWDSSLTLFISRDDKLVEGFRQQFTLSEDLLERNTRENFEVDCI